ncbi:MAG: tripartite tricarboxylate transporter substrate binding protein [Lautropia sp.]
MISRRSAIRAIAASAAACVGTRAYAADKFPVRSIRIMAPYAAGTVTDLSARLIAEGLAKTWGVAVIVENIAAASGIVGTSTIAKSPPDGYNLVMVASNHVINPSLYRDLPFDTIQDFTPITMVAQTQIVLVVSGSSDIRDVNGLLAKARREPGRLNYGSAGNGSVGHLIMEQIKQLTGVFVTHIPYRGQNQALTDLLSGQVDLALPALGVADPFLKSGRMRAIGVVSSRRSTLAPEIPTVQEQIGKPLEGLAWWGLLGPRGMPAELVETIGSAVRTLLRSPAGMDRIRALGADTVASTSEEMAATMRTDLARVAGVVAAAKLKID